jgi:hypothetical protein
MQHMPLFAAIRQNELFGNGIVVRPSGCQSSLIKDGIALPLLVEPSGTNHQQNQVSFLPLIAKQRTNIKQ